METGNVITQHSDFEDDFEDEPQKPMELTSKTVTFADLKPSEGQPTPGAPKPTTNTVVTTSLARMDSTDREELFVDLMDKVRAHLASMKGGPKSAVGKSAPKKTKNHENNPPADGWEDQLEALQSKLGQVQKENETLKLQLRRLRVKNPTLETTAVQSHPFLRKKGGEEPKKPEFFDQDHSNFEITFKMKARMVDFVKQLEKQMNKLQIPIVPPEPLPKKPVKPGTGKQSTKRGNSKPVSAQATPPPPPRPPSPEPNPEEEFDEDIAKKQSEIDDLTMKILEEEDEVELMEAIIEDLMTKKAAADQQLSENKREMEKTKLMAESAPDLESELEMLVRKEAAHKQKIADALTNPIFAKKKQLATKVQQVDFKREKLLALKTEVEKMGLRRDESIRETERVETEISNRTEELRRLECRLSELKVIEEAKKSEKDLHSILGRVAQADTTPLLGQIYGDLVGVLQRTSQHKASRAAKLATALTEKGSTGINSVEKHQSEKLNLKSVLSGLSKRLMDLKIELENIQGGQTAASDASVAKKDRLNDHFMHLRSLAMYAWLHSLPNNLTPLSIFFHKENPASLTRRLYDLRLEKNLEADFDSFPDGLLLSIENLRLTDGSILADRSEPARVKVFAKMGEVESLVYSQENFSHGSVSFRYVFPVYLKTKASFLKLLQETVTVEMRLEIPNALNTISGFVKFGVGSFMDQQLLLQKQDASKKVMEMHHLRADLERIGIDSGVGPARESRASRISPTKAVAELERQPMAACNYHLYLKSSKDLAINPIFSQLVAKKKIDTLRLAIYAAFGLSKGAMYTLRVTGPHAKITNLKPVHPTLKIEESYPKNQTDIALSEFVEGPNPSFDFQFDFDLTSDSQVEPFPMHVTLVETPVGEPRVQHEVARVTLQVNQFFVHEKSASMNTFHCLKGDVKGPAKGLLIALFNPDSYHSPVQVLDGIYDRGWFLTACEKVARVIEYKVAKREIILPTVFPEGKATVAPAEFLRSCLNTDRKEFQNSPLKRVISDVGEKIVVFGNGFEFELFWAFGCKAESFYNPRDPNNGSVLLEKGLLDDQNHAVLPEISLKFFRTLFLRSRPTETAPSPSVQASQYIQK